MDKEEFVKETTAVFEFLIKKYGFRIKSTQSDNQTYRVVYQNKTTAVKIFFEVRDQWIILSLFRLIDGKIKEAPIIICRDSELNEFYLENLLILRDPETDDALEKLYSGKVRNFKKVLQLLASGLKKNAEDILKGDFTIFPELEKIVKSRIKPRKNVSEKEKKLIALLNKS